jgi:hypothetical protein
MLLFLLVSRLFGYKPVEDYKGIHPPQRYIILSLKKNYLQRFLGGVKGLTPS